MLTWWLSIVSCTEWAQVWVLHLKRTGNWLEMRRSLYLCPLTHVPIHSLSRSVKLHLLNVSHLPRAVVHFLATCKKELREIQSPTRREDGQFSSVWRGRRLLCVFPEGTARESGQVIKDVRLGHKLQKKLLTLEWTDHSFTMESAALQNSDLLASQGNCQRWIRKMGPRKMKEPGREHVAS